MSRSGVEFRSIGSVCRTWSSNWEEDAQRNGFFLRTSTVLERWICLNRQLLSVEFVLLYKFIRFFFNYFFFFSKSCIDEQKKNVLICTRIHCLETCSDIRTKVMLKTTTKENCGFVSGSSLMSRISFRKPNTMVFKRASNTVEAIGKCIGIGK